MTKYLIKLGEISLKGLNRKSFQARLINNIKEKLLPLRADVKSQKGRLFLSTEDDDKQRIEKVLSTTFGIDGYAECRICKEKTEEALINAIREEIQNTSYENTTFKAEVRREDKNFPLSSYQIACIAGGVVLDKYQSAKVSLRDPQRIIYIEIRSEIYIYSSSKKGSRGLPVGTSGKGISLLSGGIDSPVSSYLMARRGMKEELLYFHAYPYTTDKAKEKVITLAKTIAPYLQGTVLHIVSFTDLEIQIAKNGYENEKTLMLRAAMIKAADLLARKRRATCIITGEALSQVASQTQEAINFTSSFTDINIFRPLIGLEKQEIIDRAKQIGTYETSILPFADCCVLFSPKHPKTKPNRDKLTKSFESLELDKIIEEAVENRETIYIKANELD